MQLEHLDRMSTFKRKISVINSEELCDFWSQAFIFLEFVFVQF